MRTVGDDHEPRAFATYSAVAIGIIGNLPDTLGDRSIAVDLKRKLASEAAQSFRLDRVGHLEVLARKTARWAADNADRITEADPAMPDGLFNREADNWRPLFAIADGRGRRVAAAGTRGSDAGRGGQRSGLPGRASARRYPGHLRQAEREQGRAVGRNPVRGFGRRPGCDRGTPLGGAWEEPQAAHAEPAGPPAQAARHRPGPDWARG